MKVDFSKRRPIQKCKDCDKDAIAYGYCLPHLLKWLDAAESEARKSHFIVGVAEQNSETGGGQRP